MNFSQARHYMVEQQIRPWNVIDGAVLQAISVLPREDFVPAAYRSLAYADTELPLGHGQFMLPPRVDARLLHDLALQGDETVLEIGSGYSYLSALLALRSRRVIGLELIPELLEQARINLGRVGIGNVELRLADGSREWPKDLVFDAIVLGGSVVEVSAALLSLLKTGGRLMAIVGTDPVMHTTLFTRLGPSEWTSRSLWDCVAPPLLGFPQTHRFRF